MEGTILRIFCAMVVFMGYTRGLEEYLQRGSHEGDTFSFYKKSEWTKCTRTCHGGSFRFTFYRGICKRKIPCYRYDELEARSCGEAGCILKESLCTWSHWTSCSATCGPAVRVREVKWHHCTNPTPGRRTVDWEPCHNLPKCSEAKDTHTQKNETTPEAGKLPDRTQCRMSNISECSRPCGTGFQWQTRWCPTSRGSIREIRRKTCNAHACKDNRPDETPRIYNNTCRVTRTSHCSRSCGPGMQVQIVECTDGGTLGRRGSYHTNITRQRQCDLGECPGPRLSWSEWGDWSQCSATCGSGVKRRQRECLASGCNHTIAETATCNIAICPGPLPTAGPSPIWSTWSKWGSCGGSCERGIKQRTRTCSQPPNCQGPTTQTGQCDLTPCERAVLGDWSDWQPDGVCDVTCGNGRLRQVRTCSPQSATCEGSPTRTIQCNEPPCQTTTAKGVWGEWTPKGACSRTCGKGTQKETRRCSVQPPLCEGDVERNVPCNQQPCPPDARSIEGESLEWTNWSDCSKTCGGGTMKRERRCRRENCQHIESENKTCNKEECPRGPGQGPEPTPNPDKGSGSGPDTGPNGNATITTECELDPVTGPCRAYFPRWFFNTSVAECQEFIYGGCQGNGNRFMTEKECTNTCGPNSQFELPTRWSDWLEWEACSSQCGGGTRNRTRSCLSNNCLPGRDFEMEICNDQPCL